jgi:hypothetical protein
VSPRRGPAWPRDERAGAITTAKLADQAVTAAKLGNLVSVTRSAPIGGNGVATVVVGCPAGTRVISGGCQPSVFGVEMTTSRPTADGWQYQARNQNAGAATMTAFANCLAG